MQPVAGAMVRRLALAVLLVLAGCGGDGGGDPQPEAVATVTTISTPQPETPAVTPVPRASVDVTRPAAGATVGARVTGERLVASVRVEGFAAPGDTVTVASGCARPACRVRARAGDNGNWTVRVRVVASRRARRAHVRASSSTPGPPQRVPIRLKRRAAAAPPAPEPAATATPTPPPVIPPRHLVLIGDSLAVGIQNRLPGLLPGWTIRASSLSGRPLAAGMRIAERTDLTAEPTVLAVSLFTNDDPRSTAALEAAVRRSVALVGRHGCAVWATIQRPPLRGVSYRAANATLERLAADPSLGGALLVVPWAEEVARHPEWLGRDRVHATDAGYQARAQMYAQAAQACAR